MSCSTSESSHGTGYPQPQNDGEVQAQDKSLLCNPTVDRDEVVTFAHLQERFYLTSDKVKDLPNYEDVTAYGVPKSEQKRLWILEIERLLKSMEQPKEPLFSSMDFLGATVEAESLMQLSDLADQLVCNLAVVYYDSMVQYEPDKKARQKIMLYKVTLNRVRRLADCIADDSEEYTRGAKRPNLLSEHNREVYYLLVDYITAIVSRYLHHCAVSIEWHKLSIATVAKIATKLKILEKSPSEFANVSLETADYKDDEKQQHDDLNFLGKGPSIIHGDEEARSHKPFHVYEGMEWTFRQALHVILNAVLKSLYHPRQGPDQHQTSFNITSRIYRTGLSATNNNQTLIHNDDHGYCSTTDQNYITHIRAAFDILLQNADEMVSTKSNQSLKVHTTTPGGLVNPTITANWTWKRTASLQKLRSGQFKKAPHLNHEPSGSLVITNIDGLIAILVPLSLCDAHIGSYTNRCLLMMSKISIIHEADPPLLCLQEDFEVNFSLRSRETTISKRLTGPVEFCRQLEDDTILSGTFLPGMSMTSSAPTPTRSWSRTVNQTFSRQMTKTKEWKIDEASVTVPIIGCVLVIISLSAALVFLGLLLPLLCIIHINGVDPSNLAIFVWVTVLFFVLLAQAWYVPHWSWHDFLHGRIVCHSVSELSAVTGIHPQYILYRLLVNEKTSILQTRGPYNGVFGNKRSDQHGLAIDVACDTSTLFASGFVLLYGLSSYDWHILCLDARKGSTVLQKTHNSWGKCCGVPLSVDGNRPDKKTVLKVTDTELTGDRILGLFVGDRKFG